MMRNLLQLASEHSAADVDNDDGEQDLNRDAYKVKIQSSRLFNLVVGFIACGASFRMSSRLVCVTKTISHMSCFGGCSEGRAASYVRVVCAASLQKISELLRIQWAFSLALDVGSKQGTSYLDYIRRYKVSEKFIYLLRNLKLPVDSIGVGWLDDAGY